MTDVHFGVGGKARSDTFLRSSRRVNERLSYGGRRARSDAPYHGTSTLAQFDFFFVGEVGGDFLGDFAGGDPFGPALESGDEADAFLGAEVRAVVVAEGGVEDATFDVIADEEEGFVFARTGLFFGGEGAGENGEIFGGAAEAIVEFVFGVHPFFGKAAHDGVFGSAGDHQEGVLFAVAAAATRSRVGFPGAVAQAEVGTGFFVAIVPAAEADHFVVSGPFGKGIVGSVNGDEAAAIFHVAFEVGFGFIGPGFAVVI
jgi:hypothetical protein